MIEEARACSGDGTYERRNLGPSLHLLPPLLLRKGPRVLNLYDITYVYLPCMDVYLLDMDDIFRLCTVILLLAFLVDAVLLSRYLCIPVRSATLQIFHGLCTSISCPLPLFCIRHCLCSSCVMRCPA